jgi:YbgC/YbaW family acyl-CoA thioester hydrolase
MDPHFVAKHRVEFFETDLAGIVHFANFYRIMEQAEHQFFRSLGLKIHGKLPDGSSFGWPRVNSSCSFKSPAYYGDEIEISLTVQRVTRRSLSIAYEFRRGETVLANGEMKTAYCIVPVSGKLESAEMTDEYYSALSKFGGG